eukprot:Rhum_TRINITY_DN14096_c3_g2::Rhum_TRINITY_DN14096_c3_g2_i1::g.67412::m.67412
MRTFVLLAASAAALAQDQCDRQTGGHQLAIVCPEGYYQRSTYGTINCDYETTGTTRCRDECCHRVCSDVDFTCSTGFQKKKDANLIDCAGNTCTTETCCDSIAVKPIDNRAAIKHLLGACGDDNDCRRHGDAAARCNAGACTCSANYQTGALYRETYNPLRCLPRMNAAQERRVVFLRGRTGHVCVVNKALPALLKAKIHTALETVYGTNSYVRSVSFHCTEVSGVASVEGAFSVQWATTFSESRPAIAIALTALIQKDQYLVERLGAGVSTLTTGSTCALAQAKKAQRLSAGNQCTVLECNTGFYVPASNDISQVCVAKAVGKTPACLVDGDCTWDAETDSKKKLAVCTTGVCTANATLEAQIARAAPSPVIKHFCQFDEDCRASGDKNAVCDKNGGLGNWCKCGSGHAYPSKYLPVCVSGTPETVQLGWRLVFGKHSLVCPLTEQAKADVRSLVEAVLGPVRNESFQVFCSEARGVAFVGTSSVALGLATELSTAYGTEYLNSRYFVKELRRPKDETTARAASAQQQNNYGSLNGAEPTVATVGALVQCENHHAASAFFDLSGATVSTEVCQAVTCIDLYHRVRDVFTNQWICVPVTPEPTAIKLYQYDEEEGEGPWKSNSQQRVALAVGITVCVLLFVATVGVIFGCKAGGGSAEDEAIKDVDGEEEAAEDV